jgi:2-(3-amino-3-carboxypropyl)histidine synthase
MWLKDVSELVPLLLDREARRIALQFPEGLKRRAPGIAEMLRGAGFSVIISGDPCYGACDTATETLQYSDLLVHFGHTPIGRDDRVVHVPLVLDFDIQIIAHALPLLREKRVGLVTTAQHLGMIPAITGYLAEHGIEAVACPGGERAPGCGQVLGCSFEAARASGTEEILFVGTGLFHPVGIRLATGKRVIALDPFTGEAAEPNPGRLVRRRYALIEKARGASTFGVILSSKPGQTRQELAERLVSLHPHAYLVLMREVDPAELLNLGFPAYVNTACPRLAYDDQPRFPVPVISPPEFEILIGIRSLAEYRIDEIP